MPQSKQRVFITGGASGLGLAFARQYAQRGARVAIGDINIDRLTEAKAELEALGAAVIATECDVRQVEQLEAVRDLLQEQAQLAIYDPKVPAEQIHADLQVAEDSGGEIKSAPILIKRRPVPTWWQ